MAVLTFPATLTPNTSTWGVTARSRVFTSPLSGVTQVSLFPGSHWHASIRFDFLTDADRRVLAAFLVELEGMSGRFFLFDHSMTTPRGVATGTPLINGASQTGSSLITDGWTTGITNIMRAGDFISFDPPTADRRELKMVTADVNSDGGGNATLAIKPPIRESPADGAALTTASASTIMRLTADTVSRWSNRPGATNPFSSFVIDCVESIF